MQSRRTHWLSIIGFALLGAAVAALGVIAYLQHQDIASLTTSETELEQTIVEKNEELDLASTTIMQLEQQLTDTQHRLEEMGLALNEEMAQVDRFRRQVNELTGTVSSLDRLSRIDRELLQKYSRTFFLNENYRPAQLTQVPDRWVLEGRQDQYFLPEAWPFLHDMLRSAARDGIELRVLSAFRSFDEQRDLHGQFQQQFGSGANQFSANQGFSEHQLGTAVDIVDPGTGATSLAFSQTEAYQWLRDNAHRYGFILSYPEGNEFYIYEPWHWRFVGRELATDIHRAGEYFYDWDQRTIDSYLIKLFD